MEILDFFWKIKNKNIYPHFLIRWFYPTYTLPPSQKSGYKLLHNMLRSSIELLMIYKNIRFVSNFNKLKDLNEKFT